MYIRQVLVVTALLFIGVNSMPQYAQHFSEQAEAPG